MSRRAVDSRGFTLLEVLIAFAVLAITLTATLQIFGTGLRGSGSATRHSVALLAAESKLAEIGVTAPLRAGRDAGALDGGYRWRTEVRRVSDAGRGTPVRTYRVTVTVSWGAPPAKAITLDTIRLATGDRR